MIKREEMRKRKPSYEQKNPEQFRKKWENERPLTSKRTLSNLGRNEKTGRNENESPLRALASTGMGTLKWEKKTWNEIMRRGSKYL